MPDCSSSSLDTAFRAVGRITPWVVFTIGTMRWYDGIQEYQAIAPIFLYPQLGHRCHTPVLENATQAQWRPLVSVLDEESAICHTNQTGTMTPCPDGWDYDDSVFTDNTGTKVWDLVCGRDFWRQMLTPAYFAAVMLGAIIAGPVADNIGRMRTITLSNVLTIVAGVTAAFAPNVLIFMVTRIIIGLAMTVSVYGAYMIGVETISPDLRPFYCCLTKAAQSIGVLMLAGIAYFIHDFRHLQLVMLSPLPLILILYCIIPESPRWLISQGRSEQANKNLTLLAKRTHTPLSQDQMKKCTEASSSGLPETRARSNSYIELLQHSILVKRFLLVVCVKTASNLAKWGVSLNLDSLSGDIYLNTALAAVTELPSLILVFMPYKWFGTRKTGLAMFAMIVVSGVGSILTQHFQVAAMWTNLCLILVRSFASCASMAGTMLACDLFPSSMRTSANGGTGACASFLTILAPFLGGTLQQIWISLPGLIFTILALVAIIAILLLPDTRGQPLPESATEAVAMRTNVNDAEETNIDGSKRRPSNGTLSEGVYRQHTSFVLNNEGRYNKGFETDTTTQHI